MVKECVYVMFRIQSFNSLNQHYISKVEKGLSGAELGCFLLMMGLYYEVADQPSESLTQLKKAFRIFEEQEDELLMLLTSKYLVSFTETQPVAARESQEAQNIFQQLQQLPGFRDIDQRILFENFDKRMKLAKIVKKK